MLPPCKENGIPCPDRHPACQSGCEKFAIYRAFVDDRRKEREREQLIDSATFDMARQVKKKATHT